MGTNELKCCKQSLEVLNHCLKWLGNALPTDIVDEVHTEEVDFEIASSKNSSKILKIRIYSHVYAFL